MRTSLYTLGGNTWGCRVVIIIYFLLTVAVRIHAANMAGSTYPAMIPKALPHPDKDYLLSFAFKGCRDADAMERTLRRIEKESSVKFKRVYIDNIKEAQSILDSIGHHEGGSFPFYYNRLTCQAINGATTYKNLKMLVEGNPLHEFYLPIDYQEDFDIEPQGQTGYAAIFQDAVVSAAKSIESKIEQEEKKLAAKSWFPWLQFRRQRSN